MYVQIRLFALVAIMAIPVSAMAMNCPDPKSIKLEFRDGRVANSNFNFTYISYLHRNKKYGNFDFGRCVFNKHDQPVWIKWEKLGLNGGTTKSNDSYSIRYSEDRDDKFNKDSIFWYGPRPEKITPEAIFRPKEVQVDWFYGAKIFRVQMENIANIKNAFISREAFNIELNKLRKIDPRASFRSVALGRVALPANDSVFQRFREGSPDIKNNDFYAVDIIIQQTYDLRGETLLISPAIFVRVDPKDIQIFLNADNKISMNIEGSDKRVLELFSGFSQVSKYSNPKYDFERKNPIEIKFPIRRDTAPLVVNFSKYASISLPIQIPVR
jgi:hypothetical protein